MSGHSSFVQICYPEKRSPTNEQEVPSENIGSVAKAGSFDYSILTVYDIGKELTKPIKEVLEIYPEQVARILIGESWLPSISEEWVLSKLIDISPSDEISTLVSRRLCLQLCLAQNGRSGIHCHRNIHQFLRFSLPPT